MIGYYKRIEKCAKTERKTKRSKMSQEKMFALIQWSDLYTSIIDLANVISPKKEKYEEGEYIETKYKGKMYRAVISHIMDDKKKLKGLPLQFTYKKRKSDDQSTCNSDVTSSTIEEDDTTTPKEMAKEILRSPKCSQQEMAKEILRSPKCSQQEMAKEILRSPKCSQQEMAKEILRSPKCSQEKEDESKKNEEPDIQKGVEIDLAVGEEEYVTRKEYNQLQEDYKRLREKIKRLERKIEKLENPRTEEQIIEKTPSKINEKTPSKIEVEIIREDKSDISLYNGYSIDHLQDSISHFDRLYDAVNCLLLKLFPKEYILSHSVSGKSGNSKLKPKSQFDPRLYSAMLSIIKNKFSNATTKDITDRVHSVQKSLKRGLLKQ